MIFPVLLHGGSGEAEGHDEKKESHNLQPQLVSGAPKRSRHGADRAHRRPERAAAANLLTRIPPGNSRRHSQLS
jgi:hypothetical protein